jgi:hypothetical protein
VARGQKLDDAKREQVLAHYASCGNLRKTARECGVAPSTVKKLVEEVNAKGDEFEQLRTLKKMEWIESAWNMVKLHMANLADPDKAAKNHQRDSAIIIGTLIDKINAFAEMEIKREELQIRKEELEIKRAELEKKDEEAAGLLEDLVQAIGLKERGVDDGE